MKDKALLASVAVIAAALLGFCGYSVVTAGDDDPASDHPTSDESEPDSAPTTEDPFDAVIRFCNAQNAREADVARCQRGFRNEDGSYNAP